MNAPATPLMLGAGWFPDQLGGMNRYFRGLFEALTADGAAPHAVVFGPATDTLDAVTVVGRYDDRLTSRLRTYSRAARVVGQSAGVIDAHFALYALLPTMFGSLHRKPLVIHFHGPWRDESRAAGERGIRLAAKRFVERRVYGRAMAMIVLSHAFAQLLVERYGIDPWRIHVVPPGVDLDRFSLGSRAEARERLGLPDKAFIAASVRRLVPRMGLETLLEAWAQADIGDGVLLIVGEGPERASLEAYADRLDLARSVRFLGSLDESELPFLYRAADVSVVPSHTLEGFGLVALESLACGTPVIASATGGVPELLDSLDPEMLIPPGDAESLARRFRSVRDGRAPLADSSSCRAHAERYSWSAASAATRAVFASAVTGSPRRPMRVVYLDHCARLSGAELALLRLIPALDGVDAHVILGEDGPLVGGLQQRGISVEVLTMPRAARELRRHRVRPLGMPFAGALGTAWYVARLTLRLRRLRPEIVHTNSLKAAVYGAAAARLARVSLVWHIRDRIAEDYLPRPAVQLVRRLTNAPDAVLANSQATLATLGEVEQRHAIIPGMVIFDPVVPSQTYEPSRTGSLVVGMVGRISPWKGQHIFLEAFARAFRDSDARARVVGAPLFGEEDYDASLRTLVDKLDIASRVEFTGFRENVQAELAQFDILVHASVIAEPFGQVVLEGMAAGLPVIATSAGGPAEIIDPERNGVLVRPGDTDALADALRRLATDAGLRDRLGEAAVERAHDFSPETIGALVVEVYRTLLPDRS